MILRKRGKLGINNVGIVDQPSQDLAKQNEEGQKEYRPATSHDIRESKVDDVTESVHRKSSDNVIGDNIVCQKMKDNSFTEKCLLSSNSSSMDSENQVVILESETNQLGFTTNLVTSLIDTIREQTDPKEGCSNKEDKLKQTTGIEIDSSDNATLRNNTLNQSELVIGKILAEESISIDNVSTRCQFHQYQCRFVHRIVVMLAC